MTERLIPPAGISPSQAGEPIVETTAVVLLPGTTAHAADEALAALYAEQSRTLLRIATLLICAEGMISASDDTGGIAEEIVDDAFAAMHREWRRVRDADRGVVYLRRAIINGTRARRRGPPGDADCGCAAGDDLRETRGLSAMSSVVLTALGRLPGRQREALVLRYYADLPEAQAAAAMGVSRAAFRSHAARGMAVLASVLE